MRFWLQLPQGGRGARRDTVEDAARTAEDHGYTGVWVGDHIVIPAGYTSQYPYAARHPVPPDRPFLEAYTTLAYVAGMTKRIRIAVTVAIAPYRHPLLHAKVAATLDELSGGRLEVGIGTGWLREEFEALDVPFTRRGRRTDEYLDAMIKLWTGEMVSFRAETISFDDVYCLPRPVQRPGPPLWIGGSGPRAQARIARSGAGWLGPDLPASEFLNQLGQTCRASKAAGHTTTRASAKLWVEAPHDREPDSLSISVGGDTNFGLVEQLAEMGTTDIRVDLSRLPGKERPAHAKALAEALAANGLLSTC